MTAGAAISHKDKSSRRKIPRRLATTRGGNVMLDFGLREALITKLRTRPSERQVK